MKIVKAALLAALVLGVFGVSCASAPQVIGNVDIVENFDSVVDTSSLFKEYAGANSSEWTIDNGALAFTRSRGGKVDFSGSLIGDGTVSADITITETGENGNAGFLVRASGFSSGGPDSVQAYYIGIGRVSGPDANFDGAAQVLAEHTFLQIGAMYNNWKQLQVIPISSARVSFPFTHKLTVEMTGSLFEVYLDGQLLTTFEDSTFASGTVGVRTYMASGSVDNLSVSNLAAMQAAAATEEVAEVQAEE